MRTDMRGVNPVNFTTSDRGFVCVRAGHTYTYFATTWGDGDNAVFIMEDYLFQHLLSDVGEQYFDRLYTCFEVSEDRELFLSGDDTYLADVAKFPEGFYYVYKLVRSSFNHLHGKMIADEYEILKDKDIDNYMFFVRGGDSGWAAARKKDLERDHREVFKSEYIQKYTKEEGDK